MCERQTGLFNEIHLIFNFPLCPFAPYVQKSKDLTLSYGFAGTIYEPFS